MTVEPIRILIADDHAVVRKGLVMVLRLESDFEIVAEAGNGREAIEMAKSLNPDLILLDLVMPELDGKETAIELRRLLPELKILILTGKEVDKKVLELLAMGIDGYILKDIEPSELKQAIRVVMRGEAFLHPAVARQVLNGIRDQPLDARKTSLTPREMEVLKWLGTSNTYRQIAGQLSVTEETIRSHAKSILNKLDQPNRAQAVLAAIRAQLIELPE